MTVWSLTMLGYEHELDLLEIKLEEQDPVVDVFVVSEASTTYSGKRKPWLLDEWAERWTPWAGKLLVVRVEDAPPATLEPFQRFGIREHWQRENWQRMALGRPLEGAVEPDDVIVLSDLDEILKAETIALYSYEEDGLVHPELPMHRHFLNLHWRDRMGISIARMMRGSYMIACGHNPEQARRDSPQQEWRVPYWTAYADAGFDMARYGWHFSWMGGTVAVEQKLRHAAHPEELGAHNSTRRAIRTILDNGFDLQGEPRPLFWLPDERLPRAAQHDRFAHLRCGPDRATAEGANLSAPASFFWSGA